MIYYVPRESLNISIKKIIRFNKYIYKVYNKNINNLYLQFTLSHQQSKNDLGYKNKYGQGYRGDLIINLIFNIYYLLNFL